MPTYNLKAIQPVPAAKDFLDIVLSKTQRGTPTVVCSGWKITRIRQFYMRKVKFSSQVWHEKLTTILEDFPKVEDIHPFYSDLLNVLYDKDHYKLALGQLNTARNLIDRLAQDYVRLLKYGDSLYRCKELKRAALGRMCTLMKKQGPSLSYLEQVRQHMSRLPSIDPNTRSLLLCGYPNVGKSSMMNTLTRADVEVQPYAFTTKSLYVGHMDYKYLRWQVIDTPGILDRPLEERNTIEMQSITALAHLRACVLYLVDVSEQCGYTIAQQAALFHSIKPLFANKPVLIVCNKIDVRKFDELSEAERKLVDGMVEAAVKCSGGATSGMVSTEEVDDVLMKMSTLKEEGVMQVKMHACDKLLSYRVEMKVQGKRINEVLNRIHVAQPKARDNLARPPCIPTGVAEARAKRDAGSRRKTEKELQEENGGAGVYSADLRKHFDLKDPQWKYDIMPEIMDGHNILDFVDADIDARLAELEREEAELEAKFSTDMEAGMDDEDELDDDERADLSKINLRKKHIVSEHRLKKGSASNRPTMPLKVDGSRSRTAANMEKTLGGMGIDTSKAIERLRSQSRGRKRERSVAAVEEMDTEEGPKKRIHSSKSRSMSRGRALSTAAPRDGGGLKDIAMANKAIKMSDKAQRLRNKMAKIGEADRVIGTKMPKHLFAGKMKSTGKRDRR